MNAGVVVWGWQIPSEAGEFERHAFCSNVSGITDFSICDPYFIETLTLQSYFFLVL